VVVFAMALAWLAVSRPLPDLQARLDHGEIVNLNAVVKPGDILPLLFFLPNAQERSYVADRIRRRLAEGPIENVGELARLRAAPQAVDPRTLPDLASRLASSGRDSVPPLSPPEIRQLKPRLAVRTAAQYRRSFLWGAAFVLGGFLLVHLVLRVRRF